MKIDAIYEATDCRLLLLLGLFLFAGCKKGWLNQKTDTNLAVPSSLSDFQSLMDNTDIINTNSCGIGEIGSDGHSVIPVDWQLESSQEHNAYTWSHDKPNIASVDWDAAYKRVAYCNVVLEGLQGITPSNSNDTQTWNAIKGNALFQRARSFFELAQVYAPAYTSAPAGGAWGVPLRLSSDINVPTTRSTVSATYSQVITDLLAAKDLLPLTVPYKTRASKPAALALLARVYLSMEVYDQAYAYADSCLQLTSTLMDYNNIPNSSGYLVPRFNSEVIFHSTLVNWGNITVDAIVDSSLYAQYDSSDLRRSLFFKQAGTYGIAFRGSYYNGPILFSGLATDEMYLTRAECNARKGNTAAARNDIDTLLKRRMTYAAFKPFIAGDSDVLAKVLQEREKELLFRGLRWSDLRRLNRYPVFALSINRFINSQTYTLVPNSSRYTFPIPDDIILASAIAQNPGW